MTVLERSTCINPPPPRCVCVRQAYTSLSMVVLSLGFESYPLLTQFVYIHCQHPTFTACIYTMYQWVT